MPPRQRERGDSAGFRAAGHSTVMPPSGDNASAAAVPSAVMTLRAGERFRSEKLVGTEKAVIFAPRTSERCPARQGGRQRWASGDGRRSATTGQQSAAVGSGWQRHNAADGFGCFGTQTAPPTCNNGGSNGRREQTGCSAVRLAHLLWEQGVAGSNPVSPTIDNQPLAATQVVFLLGPAAHNLHAKSGIFRLRQDRPPAKAGFSGCIRIGPRKSRISRLHQGRLPAKADFRPLAYSSPARPQSRQRTSSTRLRETDAPKHHRPGSPHRRRALATRATTNPCHHQPGGPAARPPLSGTPPPLKP